MNIGELITELSGWNEDIAVMVDHDGRDEECVVVEYQEKEETLIIR